MSQHHPDLAAEQAHIDHLVHQLLGPDVVMVVMQDHRLDRTLDPAIDRVEEGFFLGRVDRAVAIEIEAAEANAEADKERRELVETKNQAESLLHSTKKSLAEHSDKVDPSTVEVIELAMGPLEDALKGDDAGKIKGAIQNLTEAAMKLGEAIYKAQAAEGGNDDGDAPRDVDDDIIDADFEDMGNNKRK